MNSYLWAVFLQIPSVAHGHHNLSYFLSCVDCSFKLGNTFWNFTDTPGHLCAINVTSLQHFSGLLGFYQKHKPTLQVGTLH